MKYIFFLVILVQPILGNCQSSSPTSKRLVWSDEFNVNGLPDNQKWGYEEGKIRNNEAQYYTRDRPENARIEGGNLIITAIKEEFKGGQYTSASINTKGKYEFTKGRIEVSAKLPHGRGVWPAIWTLGTNKSLGGWPACGEIDIMEFVGYEPDIVYANVHTKDYNHTKGNGRGGSLNYKNPWEDFHIYAVEWFDDRMDFYFDNQMYYSCVRKGEGIGEWPFGEPQYLLINLAIGGAWGGKKGIDDSIFPVEYRIDYVRIYTF